MKTLISITDAGWMTGTKGIMKAIETAAGNDLPWTAGETAGLSLDYYGNHSGQKWASPLAEMLSDANTDDKLSDANYAALAGLICSKYLENWNRIWDAFYEEYEPIHNYDRTETKTGTETGLETMNNWKTNETQTPTNWKTTETQTPTNWTKTIEGDASDNVSTTESDTYGFNSSSAAHADKETTSQSSKTEETQEGTYETETERTGTFETEVLRTGSREDKMTYNTTLRAYGNIGVTTTQQMIQSELELRKQSLFDQVYSDIDKVLTISVY